MENIDLITPNLRRMRNFHKNMINDAIGIQTISVKEVH